MFPRKINKRESSTFRRLWIAWVQWEFLYMEVQKRMSSSVTFLPRLLWAALETWWNIVDAHLSTASCFEPRDSKLLVSSTHRSHGFRIRTSRNSPQILPYRSQAFSLSSLCICLALLGSTKSQLGTSETCGVRDFSDSSWTSFGVQKDQSLFYPLL